MRIAYAFFAKFVDLSPDGTFTVIGGGFTGLSTPTLPFVVPSLSFLVHLSLQTEECDQDHRLQIEVFDPTGSKLALGNEVPFNLGQHRLDADLEKGFSTGLNVINFEFALAGKYEFRVHIDGQHVETFPLVIAQQPSQEGT